MATSRYDESPQGWFTRERVLTVVLAFATFLGVYVCYLIAKPFIPALAFALALAVATQRPYTWLRQRLSGDTTAATVGVVLVALLILGPVAFLGTLLVQQALDGLDQLRSGQGVSDWRATLYSVPFLGPAFQWLEQRMDVPGQLSRLSGTVASQATGFLRGSVEVITQLVITLFVLFFLYRDRRRAMDSLCHLVPLSSSEADRLFERVSSTIQATVNGSMTVAFVQAILAGLMYAFLGVPGAALWAAASFLMALVPVFGTFVVWGPIAVYLALTGSLVKAAILVGWGLLAVGMIDNFLYPYLVGDKLRLHTVVTFFSILGGLSLFGPVGLILGPMALAITTSLMDVWFQRTAHGHSAEEAVVENRRTETSPGEVLQERGVRG